MTLYEIYQAIPMLQIKDAALALLGVLVIVTGCIEIVPIKINPWTALLVWAGSRINRKMNERIEQLGILNNNIISDSNRAYFSSAVVDNLTLKSNMTNKLIRLYLSATNVLSTDPCFHGYGYQTSNPTGCIPGSIHTWTDGSVYVIDYTGTWHKVV